MEYLKQLNVLISFASLAFVTAIAWQLRRFQLAVSRALTALIVVFALRAVTRTLPPFGEDSPFVIGVLDAVMLVALVILVVEGRRVVQDVRRRQSTADATQVEYDLALHSLDQLDAESGARVHGVAQQARAAAELDERTQLQVALREVADELDDVLERG